FSMNQADSRTIPTPHPRSLPTRGREAKGPASRIYPYAIPLPSRGNEGGGSGGFTGRMQPTDLLWLRNPHPGPPGEGCDRTETAVLAGYKHPMSDLPLKDVA